MKKITLFILFFVLSYQYVDADAFARTRKYCRGNTSNPWWSRFIARLTLTEFWLGDIRWISPLKDGNCGPFANVIDHCPVNLCGAIPPGDPIYPAGWPTLAGWAFAGQRPTDPSHWVGVMEREYYWYQAAGDNPTVGSTKNNIPRILSMLDEKEEIAPKEIVCKSNVTEINSNNVKLNDLSGYIKIMNRSLDGEFASIVLDVYSTEGLDDEQIILHDSIPSLRNSISRSKIVFKNNKLYTSGIFNSRNVSVITDNSISENNLIISFHFDCEISFAKSLNDGDVNIAIHADSKNANYFSVDDFFDIDNQSVEHSFNADNSNPNFVDIRIYPNPANDILSFSLRANENLSNLSITLIDLNGSVVWNSSTNLETSDVLEQKLTVNHLNPGVYLLRLQSQYGIINRQVLIQR
jgi:hypothetical protein